MQARSSSTRLPGKVMLPLHGVPIVEVMMRNASEVCETWLVIPEGDPIVGLAENNQWSYVEGPEEDVLTRFVIAAEQTQPEKILRLTSDCPLLTSEMIEEFIRLAPDVPYFCNRSDFVRSELADGFDMEIFSYAFLQYCDRVITDIKDRQHVCAAWRKYADKKYSIDTKEDYERVKAIYETRTI